MAMNPRLLRPMQTGFTPRSISGLALWLDAADSQTLFQTDAASATPVTAPTDIAGCAIWLDGSDASTMFDATTGGNLVTAGGAIARWQDKSGNNRHATQATAANRPLLQANAINARSCVRGDGSRWIVCEGSNLNTAAITVFAVYRINEWQTGTAPFTQVHNIYHTDLPASGFNNVGLRSENGSNTFGVRIGDADSSQDNNLSQTSAAQGVVQIQTARFSSPVLTARVSSLRVVDATISAAHIPATFGGRVAILSGFNELQSERRFRGDIAEFIVFTSALADADVLRVENYLAQKWGVTQVIAPATATNDPVGAWLDKSGNGRHATQGTGANRPRVASSAVNGRRVAEWHSSTSTMSIASTSVLASAMSMFAVLRRGPLNWGGGGAGGFGSVLNATNSAQGPQLQVDNGIIQLRGGSNLSSFTPSGVVGVTQHAVISGVINNLATSLYANAALVDADVASGSAGGVGSATAIGPYNAITAAGGPLNAEIAELIAYSRVLSTAERQRIERYLAAKWGITLAPQVSNADAQDWINRVYANGGTVSAATANAVNQFCVDIENAGIRDRFYRLNLFCGNSDASLAAVRTPLYRGQSLGGTQFGNTTDTNVNFVQGDYAETGASGGLKGNGFNKRLETGFPANTVPVASRHLSAYEMLQATISTMCLLGVGDDSLGTYYFWIVKHTPATVTLAQFGNNAFGTAQTTGGNFLATQFPAAALYKGATVIGTGGAGGNTPAAGVTIPVFAANNAMRHSDGRMGSYSIGLGMTADQVTAFSAAMQTFQTALGRQV